MCLYFLVVLYFSDGGEWSLVAQAGLKFTMYVIQADPLLMAILLPQHPECWDNKPKLPSPGMSVLFETGSLVLQVGLTHM